MQHRLNIRHVWTLLCPLILLASCASTPDPEVRVITETEIQIVRPPSSLMRPCPVPELGDIATLGDVVRLAIERGQALVECNDRMAAIRRSVESDPQ